MAGRGEGEVGGMAAEGIFWVRVRVPEEGGERGDGEGSLARDEEEVAARQQPSWSFHWK